MPQRRCLQGAHRVHALPDKRSASGDQLAGLHDQVLIPLRRLHRRFRHLAVAAYLQNGINLLVEGLLGIAAVARIAPALAHAAIRKYIEQTLAPQP